MSSPNPSIATADEESWRGKKVSQGWRRASHRGEDPGLTEPMRRFHIHSCSEPMVPGDIHETSY